ncbi:BSD domain-containing protein 1-A-like [Anopheles ziemanni]|uniref:BSD domain-containing protein 1-A-like n=1 Tax=Anopheles coustani TaxID=139045 RepID=UPI00265A79AD|nr:BSD domain-containing protein 1-A-like [Anopheles coustani]XP_058128664.1 BSD domain-containing protein 1-A-like [Anopheles coustani]XP_058172169.1 BSD domain-containing protein 1-A-like [Anopheles ziemanni]XP_058172170.1 BSD domain-containing protein 1-A-like [Anopheles ziemanni]
MADKSTSDENTSADAPSSPAKGKGTDVPTSPTGSTASASSSSWWGSWIDTARTKSASVLEAVKNDLTELTTVVKTEASSATEAIGRSLNLGEPDSTVGAMKKSFSSFLGQVTEALVPSLEEDEETEAVMITADGTLTLTGFYKHLAEMQANDETYLQEPADELREKYKRWMEVVEQEQFTEPRLAKHLASSTILNDKYVTLVPAKVAHMDFWKRYLFKKALLEDAIANAEIAERKAKAALATTETIAPAKTIVQTDQPRRTIEEADSDETPSYPIADELAWGEVPEFDATNIELSEEEQARLLEEYEQEIREREKSLTTSIGKLDIVDESLLIQSDIEGTPQKTPKVAPEAAKSTAKKDSPAAAKSAAGPKATNNQKSSQGKPTATSQPQAEKGANKSSNAGATGRNVNTSKNQPSAANKKAAQTATPAGKKKDQLKMDKNHFTKEAEASSSNSDESWEKEFELE